VGLQAFCSLVRLPVQPRRIYTCFTASKTNITLKPGIYKITAYGAHGGGSSGGQAAEMEAEFSFSGLTTLTLLVGGSGNNHPSGGSVPVVWRQLRC